MHPSRISLCIYKQLQIYILFFLNGYSQFFFKFINLFTYFWLCWVFVSVRGLSLVAASGGHSSSQCVVLSLSRPLLLWSTGSRRAGSAVVAHGPSCSAACGIFPDQDSNPCPLHWQADSQPLHHQGSPKYIFLFSPPLCLLKILHKMEHNVHTVLHLLCANIFCRLSQISKYKASSFFF